MATSNNYPYTVELHARGDCAVLPGYEHSGGCDVALCPECGIQRLQCEEHEDSTLSAIWTGIWPGEIECVEYGLWVKEVTEPDDTSPIGYRHVRWEKVTRDDPDATTDLNELARMVARMQLKWSKRLQRFVKPDFEERAAE